MYKHVTTRFVSAPGQTVLVTSDPEQVALEDSAVLTPALRCAGLPEALLPMARFGLFRQPEYLHWESPFGLDDRPEARMYDAVSADGSVVQRLMDASYLVEPEAGLWVLMIDANVFEPRTGRVGAGRHDPTRKRVFHGPSDAGWNAVLRVKPFLLDWIADVAAGAGLGQDLGHRLALSGAGPVSGCGGVWSARCSETAIVRRSPGPQVGRR